LSSKLFGVLFANSRFFTKSIRKLAILLIDSITFKDEISIIDYIIDIYKLPSHSKSHMLSPKHSQPPSVHLSNEKKILLNHESLSLDSDALVSTRQLEYIVEILSANGFQVYDNVLNPDDALVGSTPLVCTLDEFYACFNEASCLISCRTGLLDYLLCNNITSTKVICYMPCMADHETLSSRRCYNSHSLISLYDNVDDAVWYHSTSFEARYTQDIIELYAHNQAEIDLTAVVNKLLIQK
jgi:hypothetical protein